MWINNVQYGIKFNSIQFMQNNAEHRLNPRRYYLSDEAKKRLRWLYTLYYEYGNNVSCTANKIGISREWPSKLKNKFEFHNKDPRVLEPLSRTPKRTSNRERISQNIEDKIIKTRDEYGWGKDKIPAHLFDQYGLTVSSSTTNRYLHKHLKICPKLSERNKKGIIRNLTGLDK